MLVIKFFDMAGTFSYPSVLTRSFMLVLEETVQPAVRIDETHEGEPLFAGEEITRIPLQSIDHLEEYQKQYL